MSDQGTTKPPHWHEMKEL